MEDDFEAQIEDGQDQYNKITQFLDEFIKSRFQSECPNPNCGFCGASFRIELTSIGRRLVTMANVDDLEPFCDQPECEAEPGGELCRVTATEAGVWVTELFGPGMN